MLDNPPDPIGDAVRRTCGSDGRTDCCYPVCGCTPGPAMLAHVIVAIADNPEALELVRRKAASC